MLIVKGNRSHNTAAFTTPYNFCQKKCCHSNACLEDVLKDMNFPYATNKSQKGTYVSVFPTVNSTEADKTQIEDFHEACKKCRKTNMELLLEYCLQQIVKY